MTASVEPGVTVELAPIATRLPAETSETADVTISKLRLASALTKAGVTVDVTQVITDAQMQETIEGSPQLTLTILDRDLALLNSGVFGATVDVEVDGIPFRLVEPDLTDNEVLQLTFEHKLVALLRRQAGALKAPRSSVTRAQFIEMMLREVAAEMPVTYVSPEVNTVQPFDAAKQTGRTLTTKTITVSTSSSQGRARTPGFAVSSLPIRYWDGSTVTLGPSQLQNAALVLGICQQLKAPPKAVQAVVAACIVEPTHPFENDPGGGGGSQGILQWIGKPWATDVTQSVLHALQDPGATGGGGMMSLAIRNPHWSAGQVAQAEQGSAFPARYDQAVPGAIQVINAYGWAGGTPTAASFSTGVIVGAPASTGYEFSRGQPGQPEDSWTCMQRLAQEVNWRAFVSGRNSLYFVTDDDLMASRPIYRVTPNAVGVTRFTFQAELGGRTVRVHGKRQPKPSEAQLDARFDRWRAPVGAVIETDGYGPGDGDWIITQIQRPLFDPAGTISLRAPQQPTPEPADTTVPTTTQSSGGVGSSGTLFAGVVGPTGSGGPIDRVYAAAQIIDRRNLPYVYGGGHGSWQDAASAHGLDCSSSVSLALYMAGMMGGFSGPIVSGDFVRWGAPGPGRQLTVWYNAGHVFIQFIGYPAARFDTVPGGSGPDGPHLRYTAPGSPSDTWEATGFASRHAPGF